MLSSILSSKCVIEKLDLARHWPGVNHLLEIEEWPFIKADLEVSDEQERAIGLIARLEDEIVGFFTIHHFGDIAYLDMVVMHPDRRRDALLAGELWRTARARMKEEGFTSFVAHCTRSTSVVLRALGYKAGLTFKLLRREEAPSGSPRTLKALDPSALEDLIRLDAQVFGTSRETWLRNLMKQPTTRFYGRYEGSKLVASACLRERRENALCIDSCNALTPEPLHGLLDEIIEAHPHKRLESFVLDGCDLHHHLESKGFAMPAFFVPIGPLIEFRSGDSGQVGLGPHTRTLSWI